MPNYLLLSYCKTTGSENPSDGEVYSIPYPYSAYAMVFDPVTGKAIQFAGVGAGAGTPASPYSLATFDQLHQNNFSYPLINQRLAAWANTISGPCINLPDNDYGEYYLIEYWVQPASGVPNRDVDYFVSSERFLWIGGRRVNARLDLSEDQSIANLSAIANPHVPTYECFFGIAYDSETQLTMLTTWLEKDHQLQTGCQSCTVTVYDSTDTQLFFISLNTVNSQGQFVGRVPNILPSPDETYFAVVTIVDSTGNSHTSGSSPITWD